MPASTLNTIELVFGVKDTTEFSNKIDKIQKTAENMAKGIKDGIDSAKQLPKKAIEVLTQSSMQLETTVSKNFNSSLKSLNHWFSSVINNFKKAQPEILSSIQKTYLKPLNNLMSTIGTQVSSVKRYIVGVADDAYKSLKKITNFLYKDVTLEWFSSMGNLYKETKKYIKEEYPKIAKGIEGIWLATKTTVLGITKILLGMPSIVGTTIEKLNSFGKKAKEFFGNIGTTIAAAGKVAYDFGIVIGKKAIEVTKFIGKISGITYALKGAQAFTSFALKVTGVGVALTTMKNFIYGAKGELGGMFDAFSVITRTLETAFAPISNILYELAVKLSEVVVDVMLPFFRAITYILANTLTYFNSLNTQGTGFTNTLNTMRDIILQISDVFVGIANFLFSTLIPMLYPLLEQLLTSIKSMSNLLLPVISNISSKLFPMLANLVSGIIKPLKILIDSIFTVFKSVVQILNDIIPPLLKTLDEILPSIFTSLEEIIKSVSGFVIALIPLFSFLVKVIGVLITSLLPPVIWLLTKIINLLTGTLNLITYTINFLNSFFDITFKVFKDILTNIEKVFNWTTSSAKNATKSILSFFMETATVIAKSFNWAINIIKNAFNDILDFFSYIGGKIVSALGIDTIGASLTGILPTIINLVTYPLSLMKNLINSSIITPLRSILNWEIPVVGGTLASTLGLNTPKYLAQGGIVTKPTSAIIGERGPEIVLPLKREVIKEVIPEIIPLSQTLKLDDNTENMKAIIALLKETNILLRYLVSQQGSQEIQTMPKIAFTMQGFAKG